MQFDADTVGASSVAADAELCMLAADTLEALGVKRGDYVIKVNNRKILDGVLETIGVDPKDEDHLGKRLTVLRAIDKLDRLGIEGVELLLGRGRKDESGDFTKGAGLSDAAITRIVNFTGWGERGSGSKSIVGSNEVTLANFEDAVAGSSVGATGVSELAEIRNFIAAAGYDDSRIVIDPSVVRGLDYYTGPVFEADLTAPITDDKGQPIRLGSVVSGGRYDGLVERFTGEKVPATGISIGVSRLLFGLQRLGRYKESATQGPVVVLVFPDQPVENYLRLVNRLRHPDDGGEPIRAEMYLGSGKIGAQTKYADKRGSPCVVIQGGDEKAKGEVTIKDLILGAKLTSIEDREKYLKQQAEAQFAVPEAGLVAAVRQVLSRHQA
jgi:histidyl-tRNA synthetase